MTEMNEMTTATSSRVESAAWRRLWRRFLAYAFGPYTYDDEGTKP